ncbi:carbohydrate sulfotransferase 15-like [Pomacea canaliculata]|uniref:carbohydrate sulfotransferase 15-like n=1 Tax=Pomacea canaliculata TaxID=400727 RepID=UPI000D72BA73|nr:carbohydrate sulfotransferase 15-like [Pomacea canaliculata]
MEQKKSTHKGVSIKDLPLLFCGVLLASIIISTVLIYIYDQGFRISVRDVFLLYHYGIRGSRSWQMADKDHLKACEGPGVSEAKPSTKYDLTLFGPYTFEPTFRNPCWYQVQGGNHSLAPHLRCLPFFYLAGFPKCGTTDLYFRLTQHQHIVRTPRKEPHWITRGRYDNPDLQKYTSFFAKALKAGVRLMIHGWLVNQIQTLWLCVYLYVYVCVCWSRKGDGSASTFWDNNSWYLLPGNENCSEPRVINADYIRHLNPNVKVVVILRNPADRLYSDYCYFTTNPTKAEFHTKVVEQIRQLRECFVSNSLRQCVYNSSINKHCRIHVGLYHIYIEDWLKRFSRDQIHVLRLEDLSANVTQEVLKIYQFLGLDSPTEEAREAMLHGLPKNKGKKRTATGAMLRETKEILLSFYLPFNKRLAWVLNDNRYLWS